MNRGQFDYLIENTNKEDILAEIETLKKNGYLPTDTYYVCHYKDKVRECYVIVVEAHQFVQVAPQGHKEPVSQWKQGLLPVSLPFNQPLYKC